MKEEINIQNRKIGADHPPFIVAEMSGNHNQSLDRALEIVEAAAKTGAHALKLQTYTADTLTLDVKLRHSLNSESSQNRKTYHHFYWDGNSSRVRRNCPHRQTRSL
jgi:sialic acid synthase SpsE